ncbi:MAG: class I SAM-dependent methyltransferase [Candidatus Parcubacteria bacterium]|nr:class I SAM-dependent methyltransferase [Candidatus Parcubacteria bacterium]
METIDNKALIWNQRNQGQGEPYKKYVTDPLILKLCQPIKNKIVLEQGCGNGHLAKKIARAKPKRLILLDYYQGNLQCAKNNLTNCACHLKFIRADLNIKINIPSASVDIVTSSMVLSEIKNFQLAIKDTYRLLKRKGSYIIAVIHPAYILKKYLEEKLTGQKARKIIPTRDYFDSKKSNFILGLETHKIIKAPHFNRTIEDYTNALKKAGFNLEQIYEPQVNQSLLKAAPRFKDDIDCPISLILKVSKS